MPQTILFLDDVEDKLIKKLAEKWNLSKAETMRKVIREYVKKK